jgi:hypothetical protein
LSKTIGNLFESLGFWIKGNLHSHTTNSDGVLPPEKVIDYYLSYGYDFLALTDHEKITKVTSEKLLLIPGTEVTVGKGFLGGEYHVLAINVEDNEVVQKYKKDSVQSLLNYIKDEGFAIIAHPYWSKLTTQDLSNLTNYLGVEIYNTGCDVEVAKGFSTVHWDNLLTQRMNVYGFAVDDAHWYNNLDSAGGWILVKVKEKSLDELIKSIKEGKFYASSGPTIEKFSFVNNKLEAKFSSAKRVNVISEDGTGFSVSFDIYKLIKQGVNVLKNFGSIKMKKNGKEEEILAEVGDKKIVLKVLKDGINYISLEKFNFKNYIRFEVADVNGKKAWINPIFL